MKIIDTDNLDGDYPNEQDIAIGIKSLRFAEIMCEALNAAAGEHSARFYTVVDDDYKNRPGFEP